MKRDFSFFDCPICGQTLINLNTPNTIENGFHHFWCNVCNIDIEIDENKTPPLSACDDEDDDSIPWNEWLS